METTQTDIAINKIRQEDHDRIIRIETKMDNVGDNIKDLSTRVDGRIVLLEARTKVLEDKASGIDIPKQIDAFQKLIEKVDGLNLKWQITVALFTPIYIGIVAYILNQVFKLFR